MKRSVKGFTLVELMITLAVLAILVSIGYPLYSTMLEKARRVDARSALTKLAMAQERHYAMFGSYATSVAQLNFGPDGTEDGNNDTFAYNAAVSDMDFDENGKPFYDIVLEGDGATFLFTATADAERSQWSDEDCREFTINQVGVKSAEDSSGGDQTELCW